MGKPIRRKKGAPRKRAVETAPAIASSPADVDDADGRVGPGGARLGPSTPLAPKSEGQRLLLELCAKRSLAELGSELDMSRVGVRALAHGINRPSAETRSKLERALGIPADSWSRAAESPPSAGDVAPAPASAVDLDDPAKQLAYVDVLIASLRQAREALGPKALPRERQQIAAEEGKQLDRRRQIQADIRERELARELLEDRIVRTHPMALRMLRAVVDALAKHPAALRDVRDVLAELEIEAGAPAAEDAGKAPANDINRGGGR